MVDSGSPRVSFCTCILLLLLETRTPVPKIVLTLPGLLLQETHDKRSQLFKLLILEHLKLKDQLSAAETEFQKKEEWREAEIKRL